MDVGKLAKMCRALLKVEEGDILPDFEGASRET
jgi:hypothetical protein